MSVTDALPDRPLTRDEYRQLADSDRVEEAAVLEDARDGEVVLAFSLGVDGCGVPCVWRPGYAEWRCGREAFI